MASFWQWLFAPASATRPQPLGDIGSLEIKVDEIRRELHELRATVEATHKIVKQLE